MTLACPACGAAVPGSPESWMLRCPACGRRLRSRRIDDGRPVPAYQVEVVGEPQTALQVEWAEEPPPSRLRRWLIWSTAATLSLVAILYALARWWR